MLKFGEPTELHNCFYMFSTDVWKELRKEKRAPVCLGYIGGLYSYTS